MTGHCSVDVCPFARDGELLTDKKCVTCGLYKITGYELFGAILDMVLTLRKNGKTAEKVYMRKRDFQKVMGDCINNITAFEKDGEPGYMIAGCVIEVRDDLRDDVLLIVE